MRHHRFIPAFALTIPKTVWGLLAAVVVLGGGYLIAHATHHAVADLLYSSGILLCSLVLTLRVFGKHRRPHRVAWGMFAAGVAWWGIADLVYSLNQSETTTITLPFFYDWVYLPPYLFFLAGLWFFVRKKIPFLPKRFRYDSFALLIAGLGMMVYLLEVLRDSPEVNSDVSVTEMSLLLSFPMLDLILLTGFLVTAPLLFQKGEWGWVTLFTGVGLLAFTDSYYLTFTGIYGYTSGTWLDAVWYCAFSLFAVSAWLPHTSMSVKTSTVASYHPYIPFAVSVFSLAAIVIATQTSFPAMSVELFVVAIAVSLWRTVREQNLSVNFEKLWENRYHNPTTQLRNQVWLYEQGTGYFAARHPNANSSLLCVIEILHFDNYTSDYGHRTGNTLLALIGEHVEEWCRTQYPHLSFLLLHTEPTEFTLIVTSDTPNFFAMLNADALLVELEKAQKELSTTYTVTPERDVAETPETSSPTLPVVLPVDVRIVGAVSPPSVGNTLGEKETCLTLLYKQAVATKRRSRTRREYATLFDESKDVVVVPSDVPHVTALTLKEALAEGQIVCYYQPIVATSWEHGKPHLVYSVEVLARWDHPTLGLIPPQQFIPVAEETGLIIELTEEVLCQSVRQVLAWQQSTGTLIHLSVNFSAVCLNQTRFLPSLEKTLHDAGFPPDRLIVEITETSLPESVPTISPTPVEQLTAMGVRISIDDYGTGMSSMSRLAEMQAQEMKLDRSFVTDAHRDTRKETIVENAASLARNLGIPLVAEGVETVEDVALLQKYNIPYMQGYHIATPQPPTQMGRWLAHHTTPPQTTPEPPEPPQSQ